MPHSSSNAVTPPGRPHNRPRNVPTSLNIINVFAAVQMFLINYDFKYFTAFFISYRNSISYLLVAHSWSLIKIIKVKLRSFFSQLIDVSQLFCLPLLSAFLFCLFYTSCSFLSPLKLLIDCPRNDLQHFQLNNCLSCPQARLEFCFVACRSHGRQH